MKYGRIKGYYRVVSYRTVPCRTAARLCLRRTPPSLPQPRHGCSDLFMKVRVKCEVVWSVMQRCARTVFFYRRGRRIIKAIMREV